MIAIGNTITAIKPIMNITCEYVSLLNLPNRVITTKSISKIVAKMSFLFVIGLLFYFFGYGLLMFVLFAM